MCALLGKNPFREELDTLNSDYARALETLSELENKMEALSVKLLETENSIKSYQALTENLRQRVGEKDNEIRSLKEYYGKRINERNRKIIELRDDLDGTLDQLQRVNQDIGREMMSASLLKKTNIALNDLFVAMESGDEGKMTMVVDYLDWNHALSQIAQQHLKVMRQKNELANTNW